MAEVTNFPLTDPMLDPTENSSNNLILSASSIKKLTIQEVFLFFFSILIFFNLHRLFWKLEDSIVTSSESLSFSLFNGASPRYFSFQPL